MSFILTIEPHQESWAEDFTQEAFQIQQALGSAVNRLFHIGSTAIPGIYAKPIVDILADVTSLEAIDAQQPKMEALGYECMGEFGICGRRYFRKNDSSGKRTHQIHAFIHQSPELTRHLAFRDYLIAHPDTARAYSDLKRHLVNTYDGNFEAYMDGKDPFIKEIEQKALLWKTHFRTSGNQSL